jgi:hypothetical protein
MRSALRENRPKWTEESHLEFERNSPTKHEFMNGEVYPLGERIFARLHVNLLQPTCMKR